MNRYSIVIVVIAVAAVAGMVMQQSRISRLETALARMQHEEQLVAQALAAKAAPPAASAKPAKAVAAKAVAAKAVAVAAKPARPDDPEALSVEEMPAPSAATPMRPAALPAPGPAGKAKSRPDMGSFMKTIGSMMTNPAMKEMIKQQAKMAMEMQYARLFKFLAKTPEQEEALKTVLMDRQMALMESGMALFHDGGASPADRKKKAEGVKAVKDAYDKQIAELLGPEDYDVFTQYEETQQERMQVEMFKSSLSSTREPLTDQQEYDLVKAMHEVRTNAPLMNSMMKQDEAPDPAMFSESGMTNLLAQMEKVRQQYAVVAARILSPSQNEQFKTYLERQKAMNEMGIKFAAQMFGGETKDEPAASEKPAPER